MSADVRQDSPYLSVLPAGIQKTSAFGGGFVFQTFNRLPADNFALSGERIVPDLAIPWDDHTFQVVTPPKRTCPDFRHAVWNGIIPGNRRRTIEQFFIFPVDQYTGISHIKVQVAISNFY